MVSKIVPTNSLIQVSCQNENAHVNTCLPKELNKLKETIQTHWRHRLTNSSACLVQGIPFIPCVAAALVSTLSVLTDLGACSEHCTLVNIYHKYHTSGILYLFKMQIS